MHHYYVYSSSAVLIRLYIINDNTTIDIYWFLCNSLVLFDLHGKELRRCHLIRGAPHDVYPPSTLIFCYFYMGKIYAYFSLIYRKGFTHE